MVSTKCGFDSTPDGKVQGGDLLAYIGPTIHTDVGFDATFVPGAYARPKPGTMVEALVDTGATESCIDALLATKLGLPVVDRRKIAGAGGVHEVNVYLAQIHVPSLLFTIYGAFAGVNLQDGGQRHSVLVGRTFLRRVTMVYEGETGTVTITYKNPSQPAPTVPAPAQP